MPRCSRHTGGGEEDGGSTKLAQCKIRAQVPHWLHILTLMECEDASMVTVRVDASTKRGKGRWSKVETICIDRLDVPALFHVSPFGLD